MSTETNPDLRELQERIEAKRKHLEAEMHELKANASSGAKERVQDIQTQLDEVQREVQDGYENLKKETIAKLNSWLRD